MLSVKSNGGIAKDKIFECIQILKEIEVQAPINFQETDYTTSSWQTMKTIVDAAKLVHENVSLNQVDVDNAIAALNEINSVLLSP